jgi:hypothetical protein
MVYPGGASRKIEQFLLLKRFAEQIKYSISFIFLPQLLQIRGSVENATESFIPNTINNNINPEY